MSKIKVILNGHNRELIDDFFMKLDDTFECAATSSRLEDLCNHIKHFKPDAFIYCPQNETREQLLKMKTFKEKLEEERVAFVLIGSVKDCDSFVKTIVNAADLIIPEPYDDETIKNRVSNLISKREKDLEATGEYLRKKAEKTREELDKNRRKHILIIDDDPVMLKLIKSHLEDEFDIAPAVSGSLAFRFLSNHTTDLILLDYEMPEMSGVEVYERLRADAATAEIPVIFLTGVTDEEKTAKVMELKPQGYLLKPVGVDKLKQAVYRVIK